MPNWAVRPTLARMSGAAYAVPAVPRKYVGDKRLNTNN